jgi:hypothetical protein
MAETAENVKQARSSEEWETVAPESGTPLSFDIGTVFVGEFRGIKHIVPPNSSSPDDEFDQALFTDENGQTRTINLGYKLHEGLSGIEEGKKVRITRMDDIPMNDPKKNDLKDYRVEVAK